METPLSQKAWGFHNYKYRIPRNLAPQKFLKKGGWALNIVK